MRTSCAGLAQAVGLKRPSESRSASDGRFLFACAPPARGRRVVLDVIVSLWKIGQPLCGTGRRAAQGLADFQQEPLGRRSRPPANGMRMEWFPASRAGRRIERAVGEPQCSPTAASLPAPPARGRRVVLDVIVSLWKIGQPLCGTGRRAAQGLADRAFAQPAVKTAGERNAHVNKRPARAGGQDRGPSESRSALRRPLPCPPPARGRRVVLDVIVSLWKTASPSGTGRRAAQGLADFPQSLRRRSRPPANGMRMRISGRPRAGRRLSGRRRAAVLSDGRFLFARAACARPARCSRRDC